MWMKASAIVLLVTGVSAYGQATDQQNLHTCLSGRYPALCNHRSLNVEQLQEARAAEVRENLRTCMTGRYPSLCDHSKLSTGQLKAVRESERAENLKTCSSGRYPSLCNHSLLRRPKSHKFVQLRGRRI